MTPDDLLAARLEPVGHLTDASNAAVLVRCHPESGDAFFALYKPVEGERPLWDFPDGCLAHREVAAYLLSEAAGWQVVPPTVMRDGPWGPGSLQVWVTPVRMRGPSSPETLILADSAPSERDIVLAPAPGIPPGFRAVLAGRVADGTEVVLAHADTPELASVAVFDAVLNNGDRKGSHLLRDESGTLWGVDHGVSLHVENKLRTVLWGWRSEPIPAADLARLAVLESALARGSLAAALASLITDAEVDAVRLRTRSLLDAGVFPPPPDDWPAVPWPPI